MFMMLFSVSFPPTHQIYVALPHRALMKMDVDLLHSPVVGVAEEEEADMNDWKLPLTNKSDILYT